MSRARHFYLIAVIIHFLFFPPFISIADSSAPFHNPPIPSLPSMGSDDSRLVAAAAAVDSGDAGKALKLLQELDRQYPDDPMVAYYLGTLFQYGGQYANAVSWYDQSIRRDGDNAGAFYKRGAAKLALNDPRPAAFDFLKAWMADPTLTEAVTDIGMVFLFHGASGEAVKYLSRAVLLNPTSARAWYGLGRALMAVGNLRAAIPAFDRAIALAPQVSAFAIDRAWAAFLIDPAENRDYCVQVLQRVLSAHTYHRRAMEVAAALYDLEHPDAAQGGEK